MDHRQQTGGPGDRHRWTNWAYPAALDALAVCLAYTVALILRFEGSPVLLEHPGPDFLAFLLLAVTTHIAVNAGAGIYQIFSRFIGLTQAILILVASLCTTMVLTAVVVVLPFDSRIAPISVVMAGGVWAGIGMVAHRFSERALREWQTSRAPASRRLLIVGAGNAAHMISKEVARNPSLETEIVGFVDDNLRLKGMLLNGSRILGRIEDIPDIVARRAPNEILIAIPSAGAEEMARIHKICRSTGLPIRTLPPIGQLMGGRASVGDIRDVRIEDFLGRDKIEMDMTAVARHLTGRRILITGAAGSIGSELVRQVVRFGPGELVLVDKDESSLYYLHEQLRKGEQGDHFMYPTSVALPRKMDAIFQRHKPEIVFHAAAYKHVPLMEISPDEAVINNVKGTLIIADLAGRHGVERMVNISTDKAVDPVNVMGATKRIGERTVSMMAQCFGNTAFTSVRFGNVLGSRGSVIPLFQQQIEDGGPVTVTHPDMTRYFMTIEEAVQLVLEASFLEGTPELSAQSGVYVLDMGSPVRILDLARQMIDLLGDGENRARLEIRFSGLRPGEKLHEKLFGADETRRETNHPKLLFAEHHYDRHGLEDDPPTDDEMSQSPVADGVYECVSDTAFLRKVRHLIGLAERGAKYPALVQAMRACAPEYLPFNWDQDEGPGLAKEWARPAGETLSAN